MEIPVYHSPAQGSFSDRELAQAAAETLTEVNPADPRSLLAAGMPGMEPPASPVPSPDGGAPADGSAGEEADDMDAHDPGVLDGEDEPGVGPVREMPGEQSSRLRRAEESSSRPPARRRRARTWCSFTIRMPANRTRRSSAAA